MSLFSALWFRFLPRRLVGVCPSCGRVLRVRWRQAYHILDLPAWYTDCPCGRFAVRVKKP